MAQESTQPNARIDAKEDLVFLTSGAKEKLLKTMVGASETAYKMIHPFNKEAREQATEKAKALKKEVSDKQASIRTTAHQQAEAERLANADLSSPRDAPPDPSPAADGSVREEAAPIPPHMGPSAAQPSEVQNVFAWRVPQDSHSGSISSSSSEGSNRAGIAPTAADYRSA